MSGFSRRAATTRTWARGLLRRAIQKHVEDPVSELLIAAREERFEVIEVRVGPEGLRVTAREIEPIPQGR